VFRSGVLGTTGVESAEAVRGLAVEVQPALVIAIDALTSRRCGRVCSTVQLSDAGIIPGSGVGNHRWALDRETLGVPVVAIGVPTVVDSATLAADLLEEAGIPEIDEEKLRRGQENLMVTPRDIDAQVRDLAKVVGYGINWALQDLEIEEIAALLS
jgi:spore protease